MASNSKNSFCIKVKINGWLNYVVHVSESLLQEIKNIFQNRKFIKEEECLYFGLAMFNWMFKSLYPNLIKYINVSDARMMYVYMLAWSEGADMLPMEWEMNFTNKEKCDKYWDLTNNKELLSKNYYM